MRWITVALTIILSGLSVHAIDFAEDDNHPDFITEDIFDDPQAFLEDFFEDDEGWEVYVDYDNGFSTYETWINDENAIVIVNRLIFDDAQERFEYLDNTQETFDNVLFNYSPYTLEADCRLGDVRLFEFDATSNDGVDYTVWQYYWATDAVTLWTMGFYFPDYQQDFLEDYVEQFQPDFTSCEE